MIETHNVNSPKTAAVIGLGYVGLPTAALLASGGIITLGVDINEQLISDLSSGSLVPKEPGLGELLAKVTADNRLKFSKELLACDAYIIAVPTPINEDKSPSLSYVLSAIQSVSEVIQPGQLIILESTSPPGTTAKVSEELKNLRPDLDISGSDAKSVKFSYCPERVLPGNAIYEIVHNERVIGGLTPHAALRAQALYGSFTKGEIIICTAKEAEMSKLIENSFRDVNIAFANEVAKISASLGVEADTVIALANRHPRVNILSPGVGVGGHCISVDPWFLVDASPQETLLIKTARQVNDSQPENLANQVLKLIEDDGFEDLYILGLSYKPNSDDLRESPSLKFANILKSRSENLKVHLVDPILSESQLKALRIGFDSATGLNLPYKKGSLVLLTVEHDCFQQWNFGDATVLKISGRGQVQYQNGLN